jgi:arsenate reductase (thioredoxin)
VKPPVPKRVLFVCIGNCCRSQMAEGFARRHGSGIITAESAGLAPAGVVVQETILTMAEKDIDLTGHFSKPLDLTTVNSFDLLVNMSGYPLPAGIRIPVLEWLIPDPIGHPDPVYREVRDQIEALVKGLVAEMRQDQG